MLAPFFFAIPLNATETPPVKIPDSALRLSQGDEAFLERFSSERAKEALEIYRAVYRQNPDDPAAGWRVSMACYFVGLRLLPEGKRESVFAEGRDAGLRAIASRPDCAPCHFWTAINMALYGKEVGVFKMLFSLGEIREHLKAVLSSDPGYAEAGANRLLGAIEENLPGILGGSDDRARAYYEEAIRRAPGEPLNYLFLAKFLSKKNEESKRVLQLERQGMEMKIADPSRLESIEAQSELKQLMHHD